MKIVEVRPGDSPLILAFPHGGLDIPRDIERRLNQTGYGQSDTDWRISQLYDDLIDDATRVKATFHRYVIDANRPPDGQSLYPGQNTTGLVPTTTFDGEPIWNEGGEPDAAEIEERRRAFHQPYHAALAEQVARVKAAHGIAVLFDCHSIRSRIPNLFDGKLPDFNIGTNDGQSCGIAFESAVVQACMAAEGYTHVLNGRFKGGWTTRHYGNPDDGVHAIQLELAQSTYMKEERPWTYHREQADNLRVHLRDMLQRLVALAEEVRS